MRKETIKKMTVMAMLAALSMVLVYAIHVPLIPVVPFLEYDPADIPILIAAMAYGPVSGLVLTVVVSIIQGMFISTTGPWGILMHVIATGTLVLVAGGIYRLRHTRAGAVLGLVFGTLAMGLVMVPANHFITPVWMGAPTRSGGQPDAGGHPALQPAQGGNQLRRHLRGIQGRVPLSGSTAVHSGP